jgi:MFS superfamily sulfate permease-like transporter
MMLNWSNVIGLTVVALILLFALLRVERKRMWVVILLLVAPTTLLLIIWANFYRRWPETLLALAIGLVFAGTWWFLYGRKLPPPTTENIKVWGQEEVPKPKAPEAASLQAEIERLKIEKATMEAELQRLRGNGKGGQSI